MIKVVILGNGNLAFHLTNQLLKNVEVNLVQVYNRSLEKIQYLKSKTSITNNLTDLKEADIYILCVSDAVISSISKQLDFKHKLIVHTSGNTDLFELKSISNKGVFYPLQSFSKDKIIDFSEIPICIEASTKNDLKILETFAKSISNNVYQFNSQQRNKIHLAAVFVNNFVNHLYHIGNEICDKNSIPFEILHPLILETATKIASLKPIDAQTGPAKRNDSITIKKHKAMLTQNQQEIYTLLTKSIYKTYGEKL